MKDGGVVRLWTELWEGVAGQLYECAPLEGIIIGVSRSLRLLDTPIYLYGSDGEACIVIVRFMKQASATHCTVCMSKMTEVLRAASSTWQ